MLLLNAHTYIQVCVFGIYGSHFLQEKKEVDKYLCTIKNIKYLWEGKNGRCTIRLLFSFKFSINLTFNFFFFFLVRIGLPYVSKYYVYFNISYLLTLVRVERLGF